MHKWLEFDREKETDKICKALRNTLVRFRRRGYVLGISGGIDSSLTLALCVRAVGAGKILALQMPEKHSADETSVYSDLIVNHFKVPTVIENITPVLESVGFYERYNKAVGRVIPGYGADWISKIVIADVFKKKGITTFSIVAQDPDGNVFRERLPLKEYLAIVAATNFKQRIRKMIEYYHADRMNYADVGTPNRLEYDQGFFVKLGDGAADIKPVAHLYKSQIYALAEYLEIPEKVRLRPPTTDTYSMAQSQDEFYFSLPYNKMDICLFGKNNGHSPEETAQAAGLTVEQVSMVYEDIAVKRSTTKYLHAGAVLADEMPQL